MRILLTPQQEANHARITLLIDVMHALMHFNLALSMAQRLIPEHAQSVIEQREDMRTDMTIELLLFQLQERQAKRELVLV